MGLKSAVRKRIATENAVRTLLADEEFCERLTEKLSWDIARTPIRIDVDWKANTTGILGDGAVSLLLDKKLMKQALRNAAEKAEEKQ
jgi:hypothetical protein